MERWEQFKGGTPRAPRYPLEFPLQYRPGEETPWRKGRGTNISRSGLLFQAEQPLHPSVPVEVSFVMPIQIHGEIPATVICQGHVVRQAGAKSAEGVVIAVTIETYRFQRSPTPN